MLHENNGITLFQVVFLLFVTITSLLLVQQLSMLHSFENNNLWFKSYKVNVTLSKHGTNHSNSPTIVILLQIIKDEACKNKTITKKMRCVCYVILLTGIILITVKVIQIMIMFTLKLTVMYYTVAIIVVSSSPTLQ